MRWTVVQREQQVIELTLGGDRGTGIPHSCSGGRTVDRASAAVAERIQTLKVWFETFRVFWV